MPPPEGKADLPARTRGVTDATKARIFLVLLCLGWGTTWPMMKIALDEIPPFSMRVASLMLGAVTLTLLSLLQGRSLRIPPFRRSHTCAPPHSSTSWRSAYSRRLRR